MKKSKRVALIIRSASRAYGGGLICHMLLETELSISDIVLGLGYNDTNHIARYFKQKMGMSPLEYRKLHSHK